MRKRRKRRLSRQLHGVFCFLVILLALMFVRILCGPPPALTERAALRRAERQNLRVPQEAAARWESLNQFVAAVWDGSEVQTYFGWWDRISRRSFSYSTDVLYGSNSYRKPLIPLYTTVRFWRDSGEFGWGCPGMDLTGVMDGDWVHTLPVMVKNDDPNAVRGEMTVTGVSVNPNEEGKPYRWTASARRENPWFFAFMLVPKGEGTSYVQDAIVNGWDVTGNGNTAAAEIVWYDENGTELYRQSFDLIKTDAQREGSEEDGA